MYQVDTVLHTDADNQRHRNQIGEIKPQTTEPHQSPGPDHAENEWDHRQQGVSEPTQSKKGDDHNHDEGVHPAFYISLFHRPHRFIGDHWRTSDIRINLTQLTDKLLQRLTVPNILLRIDL